MSWLPFDILIAAVSFLAGLIGALIGLGGGILITPLLVLLFGIDIRYAMGAALVSVVATSSGAAAAYLREGLSNIRIAMFLNVATTSGAIAGASLVAIADPRALSLVFGIALLATVLLSLRPLPPADNTGGDALARRLGFIGELPDGSPYGARHVPAGFAMMIVAGLLSGLLGIGSGAFKVLAMDRIMRIPFKVSTTTSNFMIGVTAAASVGIYLRNGYFDPELAGPVALGVLGGAFAGARLLPIAPVRLLRVLFLTAVAWIGIQMIARAAGFNL
jgi:hypothetical protein